MYSLKKIFKSSQESQTEFNNSVCDSLKICYGKSMKGDIIITGDCNVEGEFSGKLITDGKLIITKTGKFHGDIYAENIIVEGFFEGTVICKSNFLAKNTSKIIGQINAVNFEFEESVNFDGTINQINKDEFSKYLRDRDTPKLKPKIELTNTFVKPVELLVENTATKKDEIKEESKIKVVKLNTSKKIKVDKLEADIQEPIQRQSWF